MPMQAGRFDPSIDRLRRVQRRVEFESFARRLARSYVIAVTDKFTKREQTGWRDDRSQVPQLSQMIASPGSKCPRKVNRSPRLRRVGKATNWPPTARMSTGVSGETSSAVIKKIRSERLWPTCPSDYIAGILGSTAGSSQPIKLSQKCLDMRPLKHS